MVSRMGSSQEGATYDHASRAEESCGCHAGGNEYIQDKKLRDETSEAQVQRKGQLRRGRGSSSSKTRRSWNENVEDPYRAPTTLKLDNQQHLRKPGCCNRGVSAVLSSARDIYNGLVLGRASCRPARSAALISSREAHDRNGL